MFRLHDVSYAYGGSKTGVAALSHVSLDVAQGESRWLLGPSGAGKSSLLSILSLEVQASSGMVGFWACRSGRRGGRGLRGCGGASGR